MHKIYRSKIRKTIPKASFNILGLLKWAKAGFSFFFYVTAYMHVFVQQSILEYTLTFYVSINKFNL